MKLKEFRKQKGMTQEEVAEHIGIPKKTYQNYEREVREPNTDVLSALADLYDVSLDELTGRFDVSGSVQAVIGRTVMFEDELAELNICYFNMNSEAREALMTMAHTMAELFPKD